MAYYLDINPTNRTGTQHVTIPEWNVTGDFTIEIECEIYNETLSGADGFLFSGGTSGGGLEMYRDSGSNQFRPSIWYNNAKNLVSATDIWPYVSIGVVNPRVIRIQRTGNSVSTTFDGVPQGSVTISSGSAVKINTIAARPNVSFTLGFRLYKLTLTSASDSRVYDASLSGGAGTLLPTVSGTNQGTLVNSPTWIFYDDGGAITSTIEATWPQLTIVANQTATIPDADSTIAFTWPQLSVSAEQLTIAPVSTSAAFNWPQLSVSVNQSSAAPQFDSAVNFTWPQLSISAEQSAAYSGNVINFTWPQLSVLASQSSTIPDIDTAVSFTWPQLTVGINQITPVENPEYNFPISGYRNNNQWRFSPFFKQTK